MDFYSPENVLENRNWTPVFSPLTTLHRGVFRLSHGCLVGDVCQRSSPDPDNVVWNHGEHLSSNDFPCTSSVCKIHTLSLTLHSVRHSTYRGFYYLSIKRKLNRKGLLSESPCLSVRKCFFSVSFKVVPGELLPFRDQGFRGKFVKSVVLNTYQDLQNILF